MLSIYVSNLRPQAAVESIVSATAAFPERTLKKWHKINFADSEYIHVVISGEVELRRTSDELNVFVVSRPSLLGITNLYYKSEHIYGVVRSNAVVRSIKKEDFLRVIAEQGLWPELSKILSWHICIMSKRDDILVARSAYSVVREFLLEINDLINLYNRDVNIYDYIQEYTNLARSTIIKILSDLKKGDYIVVEKGKLVTINALPERY